ASSMDLTAAMEKKDNGFSFMNFPAIKLKADIRTVVLGENRILTDFEGELLCDKSICRNANLRGKTGVQKPFVIQIRKNKKNGRFLTIVSYDAGSFLRVFGVLDGMNGGKLRVNGNYKGNNANSTLTGKLTVTEHTIKDAPLLGRVLSLASLTGFFDALAGNGIRFDELSMPFTLHNDVVTLKKGRTFGPAIGLTVDGTITFPTKIMDLQGALAPSYTLNSVLGKVPLFGKMLTGGEGQGVFAARYSIKGLEENADVSVNPLSILTPGFLRGVFDVFDD
ncbi:MAG: AsmA-like C-terminal domain-containing protein, partial [Rickettsiales bacterium]